MLLSNVKDFLYETYRIGLLASVKSKILKIRQESKL